MDFRSLRRRARMYRVISAISSCHLDVLSVPLVLFAATPLPPGFLSGASWTKYNPSSHSSFVSILEQLP